MEEKMMPGQELYTLEEWERRNRLIDDACSAEELFGLDELEQFMKELKSGACVCQKKEKE